MNVLDECIEMFASLPGVGRKTAFRYVIHLLRSNQREMLRLREVIDKALQELRECPVCHSIIGEKTCKYCCEERISGGVLCVVRDFRDLLAIENTGKFKGSYHILGGLISPVEGIGPQHLNIQTLENRLISQANPVKEIIFALGATREAETTQFYLFKRFRNLVPQFSTLPKGITYGTELEYTDDITLGGAIENRIPLVE